MSDAQSDGVFARSWELKKWKAPKKNKDEQIRELKQENIELKRKVLYLEGLVNTPNMVPKIK